MSDDRQVYYRATKGDVKPVGVAKNYAVDMRGKVRPGFYPTKVQAWAAILNQCRFDVGNSAIDVRAAKVHLEEASKSFAILRDRESKAIRNFTEWRQSLIRDEKKAVAATN